MPTLDELLAEARSNLARVGPQDAQAAVAAGEAVLIDIRSDEQRARDGHVPCAVRIARNVLEWRCAPSSEHRDPRVSDPGTRAIVMCDEGYQSSLAAATLQQLGLEGATDLDGGFQAWRSAGLPVEPLPR
jgi:rhodanese-related sulfurtransferase